MADEITPNWLNLTTLGSSYEEQIDTNAPPSASHMVSARHRQRRYTGQPAAAWRPGRAPR